MNFIADRKLRAFGRTVISRLAMAALLGALIMSSVPATAAEGDSPYFNFFHLEFPGALRDRVVIDLDGDGLKDLALLFSRSDQPDNFWLTTCLQSKAGGFAGNCSNTPLPASARVFDIGEVDGKPGAELVIVTPEGVKMASFAQGRFGPFKPALTIDTLLSGTKADRPLHLRSLWDIDGDGRAELIVPRLSGPQIYKYRDGGFQLFQTINSPALVTYRVGSLGDIMVTDDVNQFLRFRVYQQRVTAHFTAPDVFIEDFNGDGRLDVITLVDNTLRVFLQGKEGRFPERPSLELKRSILPPEEKGVGFAGEAMTFADLDGDGLGDIIMLKWGTSEERTRVDRYIYYGRPGLEYPEEPDQVIRSESVTIDFGIYDLNRNGKMEIIIPFFHFAPAQALKVMTENVLKIQYRVFIMQADGRYSQEPGKPFARVDRRIQVNYKIDLLGMIFDFKSMLEGNFRPLLSFGYDFNGNGYPDLIADSGDDKLNFYWGNEDIEYSRRPDHTIDYETALDYDIVDLNGDGKADVITYYDSRERTRKKRDLARMARDRGLGAGADYELEQDSALAAMPEGSRIKMLISR